MLSLLISLVLVSLGIGFAPSANAVDEVDVQVTVIGGDMMFYYHFSAVGAASFDFEIYVNPDKSDVPRVHTVDAWSGGAQGTYGWPSLTNGQTYYIEATPQSDLGRSSSLRLRHRLLARHHLFPLL
jgi:hypothetical protein